MTSAVNGLPKTHLQRSDFPWRKGARTRRTDKNVVGLCLTQFGPQNPYRRVRPIGDEGHSWRKLDVEYQNFSCSVGTEKSRKIQLSPYILHEGPSWSTSTCPPTYTITFVYFPRIAKNWNIAYPFTAIPHVIPLYTYKLTYFYMKYVVILFIV